MVWKILSIKRLLLYSDCHFLSPSCSFIILWLLVESTSNILDKGILLASASRQYIVDPVPSQRYGYTRTSQQSPHVTRYGQNNGVRNNNNNDRYANNHDSVNDNNNNNNNHINNVYDIKRSVASLHNSHQYEASVDSTNMILQKPFFMFEDRIRQNKCRIWVPIEAVEKYPWANRLPIDETNQLQEIEICCHGYGPVRWHGNTLCRPLCDNCQNGVCMAPGVCQCYEEFVRNDNGDCVFTCPLGCLNGRCYLDGSCQCDPGYKLDETRKFCRPICSNGCSLNKRHNCTEPEVCGCAAGYQLTVNSNDCQPICNPECGVGGICREPNICECDHSHTLKDGTCQSECYQKCDNGICYGRNRCVCNRGFRYHEKSTQCIPV